VNLQKEFLSPQDGVSLLNLEISRCLNPLLLVGSARSIERLVGLGLVLTGQVQVISDVVSHPTLEQAVSSVKDLGGLGIFEVVAVGGGSSIDFAKGLIFELAKHNDECGRFLAIPTTAGSGSESTSFATFWDGGSKQSISEEFLVPDEVIYIPELLRTQSSRQFVTTTCDAVAHCMDTLWNKNATKVSISYARDALQLLGPVVEYLPEDPGLAPPSLLSDALLGATLAGRAINISKTSLSHALSYPLTSKLGIPHGLAVGLTLYSILNLVTKTDLENDQTSSLDEFLGIVETISRQAKEGLGNKAAEVRARIPEFAGLTLEYSRSENFIQSVTKRELEEILKTSLA
jgi:alcohol dehydrogenase class IV